MAVLLPAPRRGCGLGDWPGLARRRVVWERNGRLGPRSRFCVALAMRILSGPGWLSLIGVARILVAMQRPIGRRLRCRFSRLLKRYVDAVDHQAAIQVLACEWLLMSWVMDDVPGPALMTMSLAQRGREVESRAAREGRHGDIPGPALPSIIRLHSPWHHIGCMIGMVRVATPPSGLLTRTKLSRRRPAGLEHEM